MKEIPILFSGAMVRAILAGRKTQTRRVVTKFNSHFGSAGRLFFDHCDLASARVDGTSADGQYLHVPCHDSAGCKVCEKYGWHGTVHRLYPKWEVGDRLWVRETYDFRPMHGKMETQDGVCIIGYRADYSTVARDIPAGGLRVYNGWRPSIHMPRWASRLSEDIVGVRIEHVQDISDEDAIAEGIVTWTGYEEGHQAPAGAARGAFRELWDSINAQRGHGWDANPLVWAITFRRVTP